MVAHSGLMEKEDILARIWIINERGFDIRPSRFLPCNQFEIVQIKNGKDFNATIYGILAMLDLPKGCGSVRKILKNLIMEDILIPSGVGAKATSYTLDGKKLRKKLDNSYPCKVFTEYNDYMTLI